MILKRFGKVYIRIAEPIVINEEIQLYEKPWEQLTHHRKKEILAYLGERMHQIGTNMLILLQVSQQWPFYEPSLGITISTLRDRSRRFDFLLRSVGAQPGENMILEAGLYKNLERFLAEGWIKNIDDESEGVFKLYLKVVLQWNIIKWHSPSCCNYKHVGFRYFGVMKKDEQIHIQDFLG